MRSIRLIIEIIIAFLVSLFLLQTVLCLIDAEPTHETVSNVQEERSVSSSHVDVRELLECTKVTPLMQQDECFDHKNESQTKIDTDSNVLSEESKFIELIYMLIVVLSTVQMVLMMESFARKKIALVDQYKFAISDYTMKVTPMLGIAGTLYSISQFAAKSESVASVITLFKQNITAAIGTTIFAVIVYAINSLWHIVISSRRGLDEI